MKLSFVSIAMAVSAISCTAWKAEVGAAVGDTASNEPIDDLDGDGWPSETDCDDRNASVNPGAAEVCNGIDDDCNDAVDDGIKQDWFFDRDDDSFGGEFVEHSCDPPADAVDNDNDCNDEDASVFPGSSAQVDGQDSNCDGRKDWLVRVYVAVDDEGQICINDNYLGGTASWRTGIEYSVWLSSGIQTIGVHGWDTGRVITAAIAHIEISDGSIWSSDGTWRYDPEPDQDGDGKLGWCTSGFDDSDWELALDLGPIGDPANPWGDAPSEFPDGSPAHWIWDHFPVNLNTQYLRYEFILP